MKTLFRIICICTFVVLGIFGCGDDDCTVCPDDPPPVEKEHHFLYRGGVNGWVYTFSTRSGLVVDSTKYSSREPFWDVEFSKDGNYAFYSGENSVWMTDYRTGDTIAHTTEHFGRYLALSGDGDYLMVSGYGGKVRLLAIPSLTVVYEREHPNAWLNGTVNPMRNVACIGNSAIDSLLVIDFRSTLIRDTMIALFTGDSTATSANSAVFSQDGQRLYVDALRLQVRDGEEFDLLEEYLTDDRGPFLHPDGRRAFFLQIRNLSFGQWGEIWELNLETGFLRRIMYEFDVSFPYPFEGLDPNGMDFTPDGKYAFILNGGVGWGWGPIIKLDCQNYEVIDLIIPPLGQSETIRINPREIEGG